MLMCFNTKDVGATQMCHADALGWLPSAVSAAAMKAAAAPASE